MVRLSTFLPRALASACNAVLLHFPGCINVSHVLQYTPSWRKGGVSDDQEYTVSAASGIESAEVEIGWGSGSG